ncbi:hypothetical protein ACJIZ3_011149 [Penstemon smallii]|uniref:Uncharacterized protein n=1 Tax=Penstemon smallii TaxID=265156 RepID=A0ABD3UJQ3_9LAMI
MHVALQPLENSSKQIEQLSIGQSSVLLSNELIDESVAGTIVESLSSIECCITALIVSSFTKRIFTSRYQSYNTREETIISTSSICSGSSSS